MRKWNNTPKPPPPPSAQNPPPTSQKKNDEAPPAKGKRKLDDEKQTCPLFIPENTKINTGVIVETDGPLREFITDDNILDNINKKTAAQGLQFLATSPSPSGIIILQTNPTTSSELGAALSMKIAGALNTISIEVRSIRVNSRWTRFVVYGILAHIGTTYTTETCGKMAEEITKATNLMLAQPPRWLTPEEKLESHGSAADVASSQHAPPAATPNATNANNTAITGQTA
ncbi:hypothetical protein Q9L58_010593, partial [Maublancomyces gigas]